MAKNKNNKSGGGKSTAKPTGKREGVGFGVGLGNFLTDVSNAKAGNKPTKEAKGRNYGEAAKADLGIKGKPPRGAVLATQPVAPRAKPGPTTTTTPTGPLTQPAGSPNSLVGKRTTGLGGAVLGARPPTTGAGPGTGTAVPSRTRPGVPSAVSVYQQSKGALQAKQAKQNKGGVKASQPKQQARVQRAQPGVNTGNKPAQTALGNIAGGLAGGAGFATGNKKGGGGTRFR